MRQWWESWYGYMVPKPFNPRTKNWRTNVTIFMQTCKYIGCQDKRQHSRWSYHFTHIHSLTSIKSSTICFTTLNNYRFHIVTKLYHKFQQKSKWFVWTPIHALNFLQIYPELLWLARYQGKTNETDEDQHIRATFNKCNSSAANNTKQSSRVDTLHETQQWS